MSCPVYSKATEEPLLLIGPHGTAKSLLLTRVATALGLEFRHYNASLLNFDDLVGFPMPGKDGRLEYIKTTAAISTGPSWPIRPYTTCGMRLINACWRNRIPEPQ